MSDPVNQSYVCTICLAEITGDAAPVACPACNAVYHLECWEDNAGCGVYGCQHTPAIEPRSAAEIPGGYWGRTDKDCPQCGRTVAAAAIRCRHCGATFEKDPQETANYQSQLHMASRGASLRRMAILSFILCVVPCSAPLGIVVGGIWYAIKRDELRSIPSFFRALCLIGLSIAVIETAALSFFSMFFNRVP